jgi:FkbM family methyltransferase
VNLTLRQHVYGKWNAAKTLLLFRRNLRNWREVWDAYRSGGTIPPLVLNGLTLYHGPDDDPILLFREIFVDQSYTRGGFYQPRPGDTVVDLGGNIGFFALSMEHPERGARVHSFEPASATRARLQRNVDENALGGLVTAYPYAVSDRPGVVRLKHAALASEFSLFDRKTTREGDEEEARTVSLAGALALTGAGMIDLLKIDIEGAEIEVVEGADAGSWARVRRVVVEYHDIFRPGCRERVTRVLKGQGFSDVEVLPEPEVPNLGLVRARREGFTG